MYLYRRTLLLTKRRESDLRASRQRPAAVDTSVARQRPGRRPPRYRADPDATPTQPPPQSQLAVFAPYQLRFNLLWVNSHAAPQVLPASTPQAPALPPASCPLPVVRVSPGFPQRRPARLLLFRARHLGLSCTPPSPATGLPKRAAAAPRDFRGLHAAPARILLRPASMPAPFFINYPRSPHRTNQSPPHSRFRAPSSSHPRPCAVRPFSKTQLPTGARPEPQTSGRIKRCNASPKRGPNSPRTGKPHPPTQAKRAPRRRRRHAPPSRHVITAERHDYIEHAAVVDRPVLNLG